MYIQYHLVIFMAIALVHGDEKTVKENIDKDKATKDNIDNEKPHAEDFMRRFMDKLNDEEWHIAHLKPADFQSVRRSGCKEDSVNEKIKRYRKSLKEDAGRLEYVSADPLPVSDNDIKEYECKAEDELDRNRDKNAEWRIKDKHDKKGKGKEVKTSNTTTSKERPKNEDKVSEARSDASNKTVANKEDSTTTVKSDEEATVTTEEAVEQLTEAPDEKKKANTQETKDGKDTVRRSDYVFSSAEDETDVAEFSGAECPDVVDIIILEQDIIRSYDVECELSIEWSSLE